MEQEAVFSKDLLKEGKSCSGRKEAMLKLDASWDFFTQEAFKVLRTNLQFCGQDVRVVALTSSHENEGKTTVALHLAKSLAELNKKVLVIDADMRKSVIAGRNANVKQVVGLSELLTRQAELHDCIYTTQYSGLSIIFAGKYPPNPVELLSSPLFDNLLADMRKQYDYVIIDTPPLGLVIDAAVVAPKIDGTMLVLDNGNVRYRQAQDVVAQLEKSGGKVLGVVRNHVTRSSGSYYGGRYYGKNSYYGKEYR